MDRVKSILDRAGYDVTASSELQGEPNSGDVDDAAAVVRRCKTPCVIGLGGGSALDVAKLASLIAGADKPAKDYAQCAHPGYGRHDRRQRDRLSRLGMTPCRT